MEVFTIVANEVIGLSATECTLIQFSYNPEQIRDPESVLRSAVKDYLKTDEGKRQLEINCGCWNWGDVDDIPCLASLFLTPGTRMSPTQNKSHLTGAAFGWLLFLLPKIATGCIIGKRRRCSMSIYG